jgi:hypothetical protein
MKYFSIITILFSSLFVLSAAKAFALKNEMSAKKIENAYFTCTFKGHAAKQIPALTSEISKALNISFDETKIEINRELGSGFTYLKGPYPLTDFEFILNMKLKDPNEIKEKKIEIFTFGSNSSINAGILKGGASYSFRSLFKTDSIRVYFEGDSVNLKLDIGTSTFPRVRFSKAERVFDKFGRFQDWILTDVFFDMSYHSQGLKYVNYRSEPILNIKIDNFVSCLKAELNLL